MLSHLRVLDLAGGRGELAGLLLAQHGAEVIRIEPPGGSELRREPPLFTTGPEAGRSAVAEAFGRGKRSMVLDLDDDTDRARLHHLVETADVLVESWSPARRADLGLTPEETMARLPLLVHASITPFGLGGPKGDWAATDLTVMASASPLAVTGDRDRPPVRMSVPQAFGFAGAAAAGAILIALYERDRSGRGQHVDVSAQQAAALASQGGLLTAAIGAPTSIRSAGGATAGKMSLRFLYPASDGYVSITHIFGEAGGPATARLMAWVHEAGFCDEETRDKDWIRYAELVDSGEETLDSWEQVKATVASFTSSLTKDELLRGAVERRLLMAPVADLSDVLDSAHLAQRDFYEPMPNPSGDGEVRGVGRYARFSEWSPDPLTPARPLGADTTEPLDERGGPSVAGDTEVAAGGRAAPEPALTGLKVLDLTWSVAGPAFMRVLADHGATVVKLETVHRVDAARVFLPFHDDVAGMENSGLFDNMNAGKSSIALDIADPAGREVLDDLLTWADVVVDSMSPRGRLALGLNDARIRAVNPDIVVMSLTLFGLDGPLSELAGYGNLGAAVAGCYDLTGWPDRPPSGPYLAYTDYTSAHLMLVTLMAVILHRRRTGVGQFVELSQSETALQFLAGGLLATEVDGTTFTRMGNDDQTMAPHGVHPCVGDDAWVAIACQDDDRWQALCRLMDRTDLAGDEDLTTAAGRMRRRRELEAAVSAWTSTRAADGVMLRCQAAGVAAHTVQNSAECLADPQLLDRDHFVELDHPDRLCLVENTRFRLSRTPGTPRRRAPKLGEHTFEVLTDLLGYDSDRIADLAAAGLLE